MAPKKIATKKAATKKSATKKSATKKKQPARKRTGMTRAHKQALARGRDDSRAVSRYLEALEADKPRPGRQRTTQTMQTQLRQAETRLRQARGLDRLLLMQQRSDLRAALARRNGKVDLAAAEREFVKAARGYSERKGIAYATWREAGVPPSVLSKAGITRSST
jgi:hypothetical protein